MLIIFLQISHYRENEGKIDLKCLFSRCNILQLHTKRKNYENSIWKDALKQNPQTSDPVGLGWKESGCEKNLY